MGKYKARIFAALCLLCVGLELGAGYYVPGTYPQEFKSGQVLQAQVNSLTSYETELPYEYYTLPFCKPAEGVKKFKGSANPGTILLGLRIENSPYNFTMMENQVWKSACPDGGKAKPLTDKQAKVLIEKVKQEYRVNMLLDNLPVTTFDLTKTESFVTPGFPLGFKQSKKYYIFNHLLFHILVHKTHGEYTKNREKEEKLAMADTVGGRRLMDSVKPGDYLSGAELRAISTHSRSLKDDAGIAGTEEMYMVVGFEVIPCSLKDRVDIGEVGCQNFEHMEIEKGAEIPFTYTVTWEETQEITWATRWDAYLRMPGGRVHWFSILNSLLVVIVMAVVCAMILIRTVRRDLAHYEEFIMEGGSSPADLKEESGWKLVSGDVFRAPANPAALVVRVGSGVQIMCTSGVTLFFAAVGFLSPASRGSLLTALLVLYLLLAVMAGFSGVWLWAMITRSHDGWRGICWRVSMYFPGITMLLFTLVNMVIHHTGSTGAIPIGVYFSIVTLWFIVSIPLTFVGGYLGTKMPIKDYPVKTNQIPRHVPSPPLATHPLLLFFISGLLPFGTLFIELYFVMSSMWMGFYYYLFGYLGLIGILTLIITMEVSILCTYVQLCAEDYMWWWHSFSRGGCISLYLFVYALGFLFTTLKTLDSFLSVFMYVSYMGIMVWGIYLAMGTVGFLSSFAFTYGIFSSVKLD